MKKIFAAMLILALVTLISGIVQAEKMTYKVQTQMCQNNSPPTVQQMVTVKVESQSQPVQWLAQSMPGVMFQGSVVTNDIDIVKTDGLSPDLYIYNYQNKTLEASYFKELLLNTNKYPLDILGLRCS